MCCQDRACLFGEIVEANGVCPNKNTPNDGRNEFHLSNDNDLPNEKHQKMVLNEYGTIAHNEWIKTTQLRPNVELGEFIVMPNHIHVIIKLNTPVENDSLIVNTGECNSADVNTGECNSAIVNTGECNSAIVNTGECNSTIVNTGECNSTIVNTGECNSTIVNTGECNSADVNTGECNSTIVNTGECNSTDVNTGECNSADVNTGECNSTIVNTGECNSTIVNTGECNSPLRGPSQTIGAIIRGYKSSVTKQLNLLNVGCVVWQRNYYERIIRDERSHQNISKYIINNPSKWAEDKFYKK